LTHLDRRYRVVEDDLAKIAGRLIQDAFRWVVLLFRSTESVHAENLFLRRQLALFMERVFGHGG
jgi:hypothetical protein